MYIKNINSFSDDELFLCYSPKLKKFLCQIKEFHYVYKDVNENTNKTCWYFLRTDGLSQALTEWSDNKSNGIKTV